jgi:hypothetical protein
LEPQDNIVFDNPDVTEVIVAVSGDELMQLLHASLSLPHSEFSHKTSSNTSLMILIWQVAERLWINIHTSFLPADHEQTPF